MYKAVNRETNEPVAVKVMTKARLGERALKMLSAEINILRTLKHRKCRFAFLEHRIGVGLFCYFVAW